MADARKRKPVRRTKTKAAEGKKIVNRAIKFRAYPTSEQEILLRKTFGCVRYIWNNMLADSMRFWEEGTLFIPTPAKYKDAAPFLYEVDSLALANAQMDLKTAYSNYFEGRKENRPVGLPNFKRKKDARRRYTTNNQKGSVSIEDGYVKLPKVGKVKITEYRSFGKDWKVKNATVSLTGSGKWFISVCFAAEVDEVKPHPIDIENALGLDYSSPDFYVDSNGNTPRRERFYRAAEEKLAREQRRLTRMQKGSKNYMEQSHKVALISERVANQRKDFCHKLSTAIAKRYDAVFVEDINLRGMAGSLHLGKSTNDNGFGMFRAMLKYKLETQGKVFAKVDKWFPSSKTCGACGTVKDTLSLNEREWTCECCGTHHLRDHNAALNIRNEGLKSIGFDLAV